MAETTGLNFTYAARVARWNGNRRTTLAHGPKSNRKALDISAIKSQHLTALRHHRKKTTDWILRRDLNVRIEKAIHAAGQITIRTKIMNYQNWRAGTEPPIRRPLSRFER